VVFDQEKMNPVSCRWRDGDNAYSCNAKAVFPISPIRATFQSIIFILHRTFRVEIYRFNPGFSPCAFPFKGHEGLENRASPLAKNGKMGQALALTLFVRKIKMLEMGVI
jgi:hypothetical protein